MGSQLVSQMILAILLFWSVVATGTATFTNTSTNTTKELQPRQCVRNPVSGTYDCDFLLPTLDQLVARFRDINDGGRATPQNRVWFYTNLDILTSGVDPDVILGWCRGWMIAQGIPSYYVGDGMNRQWQMEQERFIEDHPIEFALNNQPWDRSRSAVDNFNNCYFQAAAAAALASDAYLFTKSGGKWSLGSIWSLIEMPALTRNPNIKRIWRVDPRPFSPNCGQRELLWDATHGDKPVPWPWTWTCRV
ncbi:hypothetical protein HRR83_005904 [Exophiala dermatitidis]|uniref:Uncharacterized protein n=2 Tax=Exophiala dermatitidis TaxID=5970 RepID=H6BP24_EXODN